MSHVPLHILLEDNHLLAVLKPAMLPTMGVAADRPSLLSEAKAYLKRKYNKPGNVYLGIVSRLDAPVSGVVLMARTSKAAARLSRQFREHDVEKRYWAVVDDPVNPPAGRCVDWLIKDERHRRMHVAREGKPGAQRAELAYRTLQSVRGGTLLEVRLLTGRKHQIRVQLAQRGWPIRGDRKYGSTRPFPHGIALHGRYLRLEHPVRHTPLEITAPLPQSWSSSLPTID